MNFRKLYKILEPEPAFRKKQVEQAVFEAAIKSWEEATVLPKNLRSKLEKECPLEIAVKKTFKAGKNAIKAEFDFAGDRVEAVLMRHPDRQTVCVSSQAGCPLGCAFCATGQQGFKRNLTAWEIIEQVLFFKRLAKERQKDINNVVFMGMGEPFLNYEAVSRAIGILNDPKKFNLGARRISVSTVGLAPEIKRLGKNWPQVNLAFSLHATNDRLRDQLMPINRRYPLKKVLLAIKNYQEATNRKVMIEYLLLKNINDSEKDARELAKLLKESLNGPLVVNLIQYNQTGEFTASQPERAKAFKAILQKSGLETVERYRFGENIKAACGQLTGEK